MEFIDHTGHIFSLPTFDDNPVALQYTESDYIFWIKDNPVSVDNYYILPIRFVLDYDQFVTNIKEFMEEHQISLNEALKLNISLDSQFYKLIGPKYIQSKLEQNKDINKPIQFNLSDFKSELTLDDFYFDLNNNSDQNLIVYNGDKKFLLFPFYVIGQSKVEGTYLSNIMINIKYNKEKVEQTKVVWYSREQMYDYLMKKTMSDIEIYECDENGNNATLFYTLKAGYDPEYNEILYPYLHQDENENYNNVTTSDDGTHYWTTTVHSSLDTEENEENKPNHLYRIRNFGDSLPDDIFHYIYRLPEDKYLEAGKYYRFKGQFFITCPYCGGMFGYNHDGSKGGDSLFSVDGKPLYEDDWEVEQISIIPQDTQSGNEGEDQGQTQPPVIPGDQSNDDISNKYTCKNLYYYSFGGLLKPLGTDKSGYTINNDYVFCFNNQSDADTNKYIRDFFFDIDNKEVTENTEGGYVTIKKFEEVNEYTQITVGCTFINECEELIINGKNMGISLPKEIIKSIYSSSFYNKYADEKLFKTKMKELLLNYMSIHGECGNFKSVLNSLKWFGWGDKIEISKLIKTDNEFQNQYVLDYFNISTDIKDTFKYFNPTNLISLSVKGNNETGEYDVQDFSNVLIGEGKPLLEDLFDKNVEVTHDELTFYKPYYDFLFNELALKLDCLAYYYQKYFLPIHLKINRASIEYKVYANTIKLGATAFEKLVEEPVIVHADPHSNKSINVVFPDNDKLLFNKSIHYIDSKFNEFSNYNENYTDEDLYYVNENCISIPIKIEDLNNLYSKDNSGEYFLIDGEYIKPFRLYKYEEGYLEEVDDVKDAKYYKLYYNSEIQKIKGIERYSKVTTDYYSCKLFLSYIDNETGEEKYLVKNNSFNFYQNVNQYYCNYIIVPRLIHDKSFDWLNTHFRISLLINNSWYTYNFTIHTPNIYLDFGKLKYRYYIGKNLSLFNQIKSVVNNKIYFNSFMYQPDLVSIDTLFYDKDQNKVMTFIEKLIETNGNDNLMYDFYKKYYKNQIHIPYNKKYYNKIHIFDIYNGTYNGYGYSKQIICKGFDFSVFDDKWSEYNGGKSKPIKCWLHLIVDFFNESNDRKIIFNKKDDTSILLSFSQNLHDEESLEQFINDNNLLVNNISNVEFRNQDDTLVYNLKLIDKPIFKSLKNISDDQEINTQSETIWWYDDLKQNNSYKTGIDLTSKLKYNQSDNYFTIYNNFFNLSGYPFESKLNINEDCEYDMYLMHDQIKDNKQPYWYIVLISRYPISNYSEDNLKIHNYEYEVNGYWIKYSGYSIDKFLVNRMDIVNSNGYNHFNQDDLIIATVGNNNYQFNIDLTSKWNIQRAYDENNSTEVISNTNTIIIPNNNIDNLYSPGYYNITMNYSINGLNDQLYYSQGKYLVERENTVIKYPKIYEVYNNKIKLSVDLTISDFKILYAGNGQIRTSTDIIDPSMGYYPIGIKIVNKGYFDTNSKAVYMGLKVLDCTRPDTGYSGDGMPTRTPVWGFYRNDIEELKSYEFIAYKDEEHTHTTGNLVYPQTDDYSKIPLNSLGEPVYPAPNNRGFKLSPENNSIVNLLEDDDTLNTGLLDENCAGYDWNGKANTKLILSKFDNNLYPDWKTSEIINNDANNLFSPAVALCWRYHTPSTNQGDWYLPAFAEVFFLSYNYKKFTEIFTRINALYPEYCKSDLLSYINSQNAAIWSSTEYNDQLAYEIHPCNHAHPLSKATSSWFAIPFIQIDNEEDI